MKHKSESLMPSAMEPQYVCSCMEHTDISVKDIPIIWSFHHSGNF